MEGGRGEGKGEGERKSVMFDIGVNIPATANTNTTNTNTTNTTTTTNITTSPHNNTKKNSLKRLSSGQNVGFSLPPSHFLHSPSPRSPHSPVSSSISTSGLGEGEGGGGKREKGEKERRDRGKRPHSLQKNIEGLVDHFSQSEGLFCCCW